MQTRQAYKPQNRPWTAKRRGTERLVWYIILDADGSEVSNSGSVLEEDESKMLAEVLLILSSVNESDIVVIDGKEVQVIWK